MALKVTHRKSALLGALAAGLTVASVAAAGSGVGGIFNLGEVNTVDAKTSLVGSVNDDQLEVVNNGIGATATAIHASTSGNAPALRAENGVPGGMSAAIYGVTQSDGVGAAGVRGAAQKVSPADDNAGVRGENFSATGLGYGVLGTHDGTGAGVRGTSAGGTGVSGAHTGTTGAQPGVHGTTASTDAQAAGVLGRAEGTTPAGDNAGVRGENNATNALGYGVLGTHDGVGIGVRGTSDTGTGISGFGFTGVRGEGKFSGTGVFGLGWLGVVGTSVGGTGVRGTHTSGSGTEPGMYGETQSMDPEAAGVVGKAPKGTGVFGEHTATTGTEAGVRGDTRSEDAYAIGVLGRVSSTSPGIFSAAVRGRNKGTGSAGVGVWGSHDGSGWGVYGQSAGGTGVRAVSTGSGTALHASSSAGPAGVFSGTVHVNGNLFVSGNVSKGGGSFTIDHPLDPRNKLLSHSFVESPVMMNVYNGNVVTDPDGVAVVGLPDYFQALNRDFRYQLTPIGQFAQAIVAEEIDGNRFTIRTDKPNVKVSWQVTGVREDRYAQANRIQVEQAKPKAKRGTYLHPELYRQR